MALTPAGGLDCPGFTFTKLTCTSMITAPRLSVGWLDGRSVEWAYGEREGLEQRGTAGHSDGRSVMVPTTSEAGDSVDPSGSNTMALQHLSNQGIGPSSGRVHTTVSGSAGTPRPMRTRRSRSRSRTPPRQYKRRRSHHYRSDRDKSPYRGRSLFSDSDDSYSLSDHGRQLRKRHRSPSSSRSLCLAVDLD